MESRLYYDIVLPLEEITQRRVVAHIWIGSFFDSRERLVYAWDIFEDDVKDKVSKLDVPESMKNQMMNLVKPIGLDVLNWQVFHEFRFINSSERRFNLHLLHHLQWTCKGLIDYRRTAEEFVRLELFDVKKGFELSCLYCLKDNIPLLWEKLSEDDKRTFLRNVLTSKVDLLRSYWAYILTKHEFYLDQSFPRRSVTSSIYYVFEFSARKGNKPATEYFFQMLTEKERESPLHLAVFDSAIRGRSEIRTSSFFSREKVSDVLCYLLSVMTNGQQRQAVREHPCEVLMCLLDLQLESIFFDVVHLCWSSFLETDYASLLSHIWESGNYVPKMFQNFFLHSPQEFRKHFVQRECQSISLISQILSAEDIETAKVIFRNIDAEDRESLVYCEQVCKVLSHFLSRGKWKFVEVCLREARLSKENREILKGGLRYFVTKISRDMPSKWRKQKLKGLSEFFEEIDVSSAIKREGDDIPTRIIDMSSAIKRVGDDIPTRIKKLLWRVKMFVPKLVIWELCLRSVLQRNVTCPLPIF